MVEDSQVALVDGSGHLGEVSCDGKSYTQRLTKKIQEQAALLQDQALQLEWAGKYARECEDKIKELDPGVEIPLRLWGTNSPLRSVLKVDSNPSNVISTIARHRQETARAQDAINKLERKAREAEQKLETERRGARELRKQSEKHVKDLNVAKLRADKLSELLAACEDAKRCAADQVRRLEYKYESSDKGAALLRAAKAGSDLEQERRHREALESASKQQELRIQELQDTVQELSASLEVAAAELQLGGGGSQLRRLAGDSRQLAEAQRMLQVKDKELADAQADAQQMLQRTRQFAQLQDSCNEIAGRCKELEEQVVAGASDRSALLDHVQDLEASKNALQERADSLQAKAAQQQAQLDALLNGRLHGHSPADIQVQELLKAKEHELMDAKLKASVSNASLEVLQQQLHATQDKLEEAHRTKGEAERQAFASQLQLQELRAELQTCVQQRNRLQEQLGAGHNAVEGLERQLAQLRQQRADARQETERLQAEHQALQSGQELLQQQLQQATAREAEASGQLVEAGGRCEELQQKLSHYESLLPDILRLGRELNALLQRQPASAAAASSPTPAAAADMVLSCLAECADSIRSLLSERQALQNDLDYAKASGEELSQQVQQLSAELASKAARCGELAASLEDSTTQLNAAESEVHRLRQELQEEREKGRSAALQLQLAADERCSDMQRLLHQAEQREQQANKRAIEAEGAAAEAGRKAAAGQLEVEAAAAREEALAAQLSGSLEVQSRVEQMLPASQQQPAAGCDVSGDALVARLALALEEGRAAQGRADGHAADCRRMVAEREGLRGQVAALEGERDRLQEALRRERLESGPVLEARAQQLTQLGKQMEALASEKGRAQWELSQALKRAQEVADLAEGAQADAAAATQEADAARQRAEVRLQEAERQHAEEAAELHAQLLQHQQTVAAQAATLHGREEDLQAAQRQLLELRGRLLVEGDPDAAAVLRAELSPGPASPPPQMVRGAHGADAPGSPAGALHSTATVQAGECSPVLAATGTVMSGRSSPDTAAAPGPSWTATLEVKSSGLHSPVPGPQLRSTPAAAAPTAQRLSRAAARRRAAGGASQLDRYADLVLSSGSPYVQQLAQHGSDGSNPPSPTSHLPPRTAATRIADPRPSPSASPHSAAISPCPAAGSPASAPPARRTSFLRQPPSALLQAAQPRSHARSSRPLPSNPAKPTPAAAAGAGGQRSSLRSPSVTEASLQKRLREVQQLRRRFDDM